MLSLVDRFQTMLGRHSFSETLHLPKKGGVIMEIAFGTKLMDLRKGKGLSQEELGNQIGVSRQTVSKWELNLSTPEMDKLIGLGDLFQISIDELLGREAGISGVEQENTEYEQLNKKMDDILHGKKSIHYEYKSHKMIGSLPLVHVN